MKVCFKCGCDNFKILRGNTGNIDFDENTNEIVLENLKPVAFNIQCMQCGESYNLLDENVVNNFKNQMVKCKVCGKNFAKEELNAEGKCIICQLKEIEPSFADIESATPDMLIKMLAAVKIDNINLSNANKKFEQQLKHAEEITEKIENQSQEEQEEPKKRARRKKIVEAEVVSDENTVNIDAETVESDIIIDDNAAPDLPASVIDLASDMHPPVEE